MKIFVADMEGVFLPEVWVNVAQKTGIEELNLTTRDISDYDVLMNKRLGILKEHNLKMQDIQDVISTMEPLDGALEVLNHIRLHSNIIILSDTFEEFARPLMGKLNFPTLLCHSLIVDGGGNITGYKIRTENQKKKAVQALQGVNYEVIAFGDSYNDVSMIQQADHGFFFSPPESVIEEFPKVPVTKNYKELKTMIDTFLDI